MHKIKSLIENASNQTETKDIEQKIKSLIENASNQTETKDIEQISKLLDEDPKLWAYKDIRVEGKDPTSFKTIKMTAPILPALIIKGNTGLFQALLEKSVREKRLPSQALCLLSVAIVEGKDDIVQYLIQQLKSHPQDEFLRASIGVNQLLNDGQNILHLAAKLGKTALYDQLVELDVDGRLQAGVNSYGETPVQLKNKKDEEDSAGRTQYKNDKSEQGKETFTLSQDNEVETRRGEMTMDTKKIKFADLDDMKVVIEDKGLDAFAQCYREEPGSYIQEGGQAYQALIELLANYEDKKEEYSEAFDLETEQKALHALQEEQNACLNQLKAIEDTMDGYINKQWTMFGKNREAVYLTLEAIRDIKTEITKEHKQVEKTYKEKSEIQKIKFHDLDKLIKRIDKEDVSDTYSEVEEIPHSSYNGAIRLLAEYKKAKESYLQIQPDQFQKQAEALSDLKSIQYNCIQYLEKMRTDINYVQYDHPLMAQSTADTTLSALSDILRHIGNEKQAVEKELPKVNIKAKKHSSLESPKDTQEIEEARAKRKEQETKILEKGEMIAAKYKNPKVIDESIRKLQKQLSKSEKELKALTLKRAALSASISSYDPKKNKGITYQQALTSLDQAIEALSSTHEVSEKERANNSKKLDGYTMTTNIHALKKDIKILEEQNKFNLIRFDRFAKAVKAKSATLVDKSNDFKGKCEGIINNIGEEIARLEKAISSEETNIESFKQSIRLGEESILDLHRAIEKMDAFIDTQAKISVKAFVDREGYMAAIKAQIEKQESSIKQSEGRIKNAESGLSSLRSSLKINKENRDLAKKTLDHYNTKEQAHRFSLNHEAVKGFLGFLDLNKADQSKEKLNHVLKELNTKLLTQLDQKEDKSSIKTMLSSMGFSMTSAGKSKGYSANAQALMDATPDATLAASNERPRSNSNQEKKTSEKYSMFKRFQRSNSDSKMSDLTKSSSSSNLTSPTAVESAASITVESAMPAKEKKQGGLFSSGKWWGQTKSTSPAVESAGSITVESATPATEKKPGYFGFGKKK